MNKLVMSPKRLKGHTGLVDSVKIQQDMVISSGADKQICLWTIWSGECCRVIQMQGHAGCFPMAHISGSRLVAANFDTAYVWDLQAKSDEPIQQFTTRERITGIDITDSEVKLSSCKSVDIYDFWD